MKTKTNKKFLSLILAISMTLTSFAGLTITTASADGEPALSDWSLNEATYTGDFTSSSFDAFKTANPDWTFGNSTGAAFNASHATIDTSAKALKVLYNGTATYGVVPENGSYYYTYKIKFYSTTDGNQKVVLKGDSSDYVLLQSSTSTADYEVTTVVDTANKKAYTYKVSDGSLLGDVVNITDGNDVTGISFECFNNQSQSIYIYSFKYGTEHVIPAAPSNDEITLEAATDSYNFTDSSEWTSGDLTTAGTTTQSTAHNKWSFYKKNASDIVGITTVENLNSYTQGLQLKQDTVATYTPDTISGSYYFTYSIYSYNKDGNHRVVLTDSSTTTEINTGYSTYLADETNQKKIVTFTTVVDADEKVAYTYTNNNGALTAYGDPVELSSVYNGLNGIAIKTKYNAGGLYVFNFAYGPATINRRVVPTEAPEYSTWGIGTNTTAVYTQVFNNDTIDTWAELSTVENGNWSMIGDNRYGVRKEGDNIVCATFTWGSKLANTNKKTDGKFYYKYTINFNSNSGGNQLVRLITTNHPGDEAEGTVITADQGDTTYAIFKSPTAYDKDGKGAAFITIVDDENKLAYTYPLDGDGNLATVSGLPVVTDYYGDTLTGIQIANIVRNDGTPTIRLYDFEYGEFKDTETLEINIDYEKAQLTGFTEGESYTVKVGDAVETSPVTINDDGTVDILDAWYGKTLTIAKDEVSTEVTLAAQPSAPAVTEYTVTNETGTTKNGAVLKSLTGANNLEYYDTENSEWKTLTTTGVTGLEKGNTVQIRIKGVAEVKEGETVTTQGVFPSAAATATVGRISGVTLDTDNGEYANAGDEVTTYIEGTETDLPTGLTKTGYTFGNWYDTADGEKTAITAIPDTATGDKSYKAIWTADSQTITKTTPVNGDFTVATSATTDSEVEITSITPESYYELDTITVTKASGGNVTVKNNKFTMPAEAVTVTVTFKAINYTVTATVNTGVKSVTLTGTGTNSQTKNVENGQTSVTFSVPHDTYTISATYDTGYEKDSFSINTITPTDNTSTFTVNAKASADPEITGTVAITGTAKVGETLTATANITNGSGDISYQWQAKGADEADTEYQNIGTASTTNTYTIDKAYEGRVIRVVVTRGGTSGSKESAATDAVAPKTYTVKGAVGEGVESVKLQKGSDAPITGNVSEGVITFTDVLEGTYTVVVVKESSYKSASSNPATITVNDENASAYATKAFEATAIAYANPTVTIEAYETDKGTVTVTGGVDTPKTTGSTAAREDTTITVTSVAKTGYSKATLKYKEDGDAEYKDVPANGEITVGTKAITIQATYTTNSYNIEKASATGGSITVNTTAEYGSSVSVSLTPDTGYDAGAITVTGKTSSNNIAVTSGSFTMPAEDVTVSAAFTQKNYTVTNSTLEADKTENNGHLTVDKTSNVHYNDSVKITIVPADGYELDTLTVNKATSGTVTPTKSNDTTYTFTMPDDNVTISATFKAVTPADPTSKLSYWTQGDKAFNAAEGYPIDFENYNTGAVTLGDKWTPTSGANNEIWIRTGSAAANQDKVLAIAQQKSVTLNEAQTDKVFYYTYSVQSWSEDQDSKQVVKLAGVDNSNLVVSPLSGTRVVETYTTVVDPVTAKKAYTYNADGDLVGTVDLGSSTVTGISFINNETASKALWIDEIEYGTIGKKSVPKVIISDYDNEQGTMTVTVDSHAISSDTEVEVGTDVTVTIAAAQDYEVNTFTVGGEDKKDELNEGSYTFTMPDENVTIAVTFKSTVVEPDPEGPAFSEWGITDYTETEDYKEFYEDHFKDYDGYIGDMARAEKLEGKEHEPLPKAYWTVLAGKDGTDVLLRDTIGSAETGFMQVKHASNGTGSGSVKYTNDVESDTYYYQYDLRIGKGEIEVKLAGTGLTNDVIIAVADGDVAMATYTTVVDTENKKVYTYKGDTLINVNEIGSGEVTGIIFSHVASDTASITNTGYADIDRFGHYYVEKAVDPEANSKVKITGYDNTQGTVTVTAGETTITSGSAEIAKDTQVTVTIESEEGYEIDTFTVDGMDKKSELSEDVYSFTMPETDITITVTFKTTGGGAPEPPTPGEYPTLSDWADELGDAAYTFEFDKTLTDDDMFGEDGIWSTDGATGNQGDVWQRNDSDKTVLQIRNGKSATLTKAPSDLYYYTYTLANYGNGNTVKLEGINDNLIKEYTGNEAYTKYTVVVDTRADSDSKGVYIYSGDDTSAQPIEVKEIGADEAVTGITFESLEGKNVYMYLDSFAYGLKKGATDLDPYNPGGDDPTPPPTDEPVNVESKLSDWDLTEPTSTEKFDGKSITKLQEDDWKFGNTNAGANFNEKHVIINGSGELEVNWYGTATYAKTDEENPYYYTYTVKTKDTTGIRSVNLSGVDNSTMLVSGKEITSSDRTFTTVVDANSKKAYTYDNATGDFVSVVDVPNPAAVKGITFSGGTVNTSVGMQVDNVSYGLVNVTPPEKPVTIVLKGDKVNDGEALENGQTYDVTGEKFTETVIKLDEPYTVKDDKTLLFMTNSIVITPPSNANGNIVVDGTKITALEALTAGTYDISITVSSSYKGEEYGSETYTISFIKPEVTNTDIENDYEPVITTETVDGKETAVNTTGEGDPTEVYNDLELPTETSFADITWTSDTPSVISNNGAIVKRPLEDKTVTLTAIIANKYNSGSTVSKQITVTVKGVGSMLDDAISKATAIVSADTDETVDLTDLHEDIKIYTKYENDAYPEANEVTLEWSSDNDVLRINGSTAEIYPTTTNEYKVKLTVKATALGAEKTKDIDITVHLTKANAGDKYAVRCDDLVASNFSEVANLSGDTVSSNISVPTTGLFGSTISWTSSVPMYMSNTGRYTAPTNNTNVTMTGIVSKGKVISDKKHAYSFTVKGKSNNQSGGSGGGGGSSSGGSGSSYSLPMNTGTTTPTTNNQPSNAGNYNPNANTEPEGFTDLGNVAWAEEAINALADKGIISGRSEHIFDPDANITRAEFATIIVKAFGFENENASVDEFTDVNADDWYYSFVAAAYNNGIISGYDNGSFGSYDNITRQDMAVIIYRAANATGVELDEINEAKTFDDEASIAAYAADAVDALVKAGVINGMTDTEFAPTANATRAQAAKMTYELVK